MPKLRPGDKAPDLTLLESDGSTFRLSDHLGTGPIALVFYRGDFCPFCNRYLHALHESSDQFRKLGAQIVAVSSNRPEVEQQTVERHQLSFPVVSDPDREAINAYDVIYNEAEGHAEPAAFVIGPQGTIVYES